MLASTGSGTTAHECAIAGTTRNAVRKGLAKTGAQMECSDQDVSMVNLSSYGGF
ncbi:hypothetical protein DPMN_180659 [Dreissena polymorpha]|uniref:Uncharacterized protein n=1 Tax=Dreissena polymorpha TaxID=45954 RepID=A0A9D4INC9_DREPO|nr:hypothetical protein DPMN_180659 [Dreissena polymorpha]